MRMKRGICLTALYPQAMEDAALLMELFHKVKERKLFTCVEFYFHGKPEEELQIGHKLRELQLSSVFLAGFPMKRDKVDLSARDEETRKKGVAACMRLYESAVRLQADKMLILSGPAWEMPDLKNRDGIIRQTRRSLLELEEKLRQEGPQVTLEFFNDRGEPRLAVGDIALVRELFMGMPETKIGITFDTSHVAQLGEDVLPAFRLLSPWVRHLHLANSVSRDSRHPLFGDKHPLFSIEGGDFSLVKMRSLYRSLMQNGDLDQVDICSFEVISRGEEDPYYERICGEAAYVWHYGTASGAADERSSRTGTERNGKERCKYESIVEGYEETGNDDCGGEDTGDWQE